MGGRTWKYWASSGPVFFRWLTLMGGGELGYVVGGYFGYDEVGDNHLVMRLGAIWF